MPTSKHEDDEMEEFSGITEDILVEGGKGETITIIVRDWNSVVGDKSYQNSVGPHWLGRRNHTGQILNDFCEGNRLVINNTLLESLIEDWQLECTRMSKSTSEYILEQH